MKNLQLLSLIFLPFLGLSQKSPTYTAQADTVIIYPQQALIRSVVPIQLPAGKSTFYIKRLGNSIVGNSLQVTTNGAWRILSVNLESEDAIHPSSALQDSIRVLEKEIRQLDMLYRVTEQQEKILMANAEIKGEADGLIPEDFKEFMALFEQKLLEIGKKRMNLKEQILLAESKKQRLTEQMGKSAETHSTDQVIRILAESNQELSTHLTLGYVVNEAYWTPRYTARVQDTKQPLFVTFQADIQQNTGLDWNKTHLILSTARPVLGGTKPMLQPEYLKERPVQVSNRRNAKLVPETMMLAMSDAEMVASTSQPVELENQDLYMNFVLPGFQRIPSSGEPTRLDVQTYQWPVQYTYSMVPRQSSEGFVQAEISSDLLKSLLSGPLTMYWKGSYVGESYLDTRWKEESHVISLGRDQSIQAKLEQVQDKKTVKTVGSSVRETHVERFTLTNRRDQAMTVKVEDQVPVSQDSRVEVSYTLSPEGRVIPETGLIEWEVTIPAGGSVQIDKTVQIKYPKGFSIQRNIQWN